jgi:hypothetical protein
VLCSPAEKTESGFVAGYCRVKRWEIGMSVCYWVVRYKCGIAAPDWDSSVNNLEQCIRVLVRNFYSHSGLFSRGVPGKY